MLWYKFAALGAGIILPSGARRRLIEKTRRLVWRLAGAPQFVKLVVCAFYLAISRSLIGAPNRDSLTSCARVGIYDTERKMCQILHANVNQS